MEANTCCAFAPYGDCKPLCDPHASIAITKQEYSAQCFKTGLSSCRRKLEVLDECLQYLHLKQAAMTTRLEEICTAQSFAPKDSKLQVVLEVESESLDNRRKRLQSVLMDMEDERQYAVLHLAALLGAHSLPPGCSMHCTSFDALL